MTRAQRNERLHSSGEKIDFKFSNFQVFQVPKIWEKLLVSIISVETGKTIARSNKALVRNGNCLWTETLSESIWISHNSTKELKEHLIKFVISVGSTRSVILGDATINIASYYTSSRSSSSVSLPLKKCKYGTILQVTIQCLTPRTKLRVEGSKCSRSNTEEEVDEDCDVACSRSNRLTTELNLKSKSPSSQDLEKIKIMETSYGLTQDNNSVEHSLKKEKLCPKSQINEIKHSINSNCKYNSPQSNTPSEENVSFSKSNNSSFKSRITHDEIEQEYDRSSVMNVHSSKNFLEAANDTIEDLQEQALENNQISDSQMCTDFEKDYKTTLSVEEEIEKREKKEIQENMEISLNDCNITSKYLDNLRNDVMMLKSSLDSQVSANKLLEQKTMKLEKVKCETEVSLFIMEEENIKLLDHVSKLESQLTRVKDEHDLIRLELEKSESEKSDLQNEVKRLQNVEDLLLKAQVECEYLKSEKKMLQESAKNLIEECNNLQKSYEDMTNGNAKMYDQYSCMVMELTSETGKFQKEVEHLKEEIHQIDEQKSKWTSEKSNFESSLKENLIVREEFESKIKDLTNELTSVKQNHKKLMIDHEKKSKLLTVSEHERQQLTEEAARLKDEVLDYKQKLEKIKNEKSNLEASLHSVSNSFEELKAEKKSFFNKMSEFEDCKIQKDALEKKISKLEGDLTTKNSSCLNDIDKKNKINRIKKTNMQYQLKIQQLEAEKNEYLNKIEDLQLLSTKSKTVVHETRFQEDTDCAAKIKMLKADLDEARDENNKYRLQLQKLKSEGRKSRSSVQWKSIIEGEVVTKERFERTKSSLERKLKDLRDRYLKMSLKYAEVEAERRDLEIQLSTNHGAKKMFQFLEKS